MSSSTIRVLSACWKYSLAKSEMADSSRLDHFGWGCEEQLNETLLAIERGDNFGDPLEKSLGRLPRNRAKKHRRLKHELKIADRNWAKTEDSHVKSCFDRFEVEDVRRLFTPEEFEVEHWLAHGETYGGIASRLGSTAAALKMRTLRWRKRIKA